MAGESSKKRKHAPTAESQTFDGDVEPMLKKLWWTEPEKCEDAAEHKIATLLARAHLNVTTSWYKDEGWHGDILQILLHIGEAFRELKMAHAVVLRKIQHKLDQQHEDRTQEAAFFVMKQQLKAEQERSQDLMQELHAQADLYRKESLKLQAAGNSRLYDLLDQVTAENEAYQKEIDRLSSTGTSMDSKPDEPVKKKSTPDTIVPKDNTKISGRKVQLNISDDPYIQLMISDKPHIPEGKEDHDNDKFTRSTSSTNPPEQTLLDLAEESKQIKGQYQNLLQQLEKSKKDVETQRALREAIAQDYRDLLEQQEEKYNDEISRLKVAHDKALQKQAEDFRWHLMNAIDSLPGFA